MIYSDFSEIITSVVQSVVFGLVMGIFHVLLCVAIFSFKSIADIPSKVYFATASTSELKNLFASFWKNNFIHTPSNSFVFDFLYTLVYGVLFGALTYIATDGVFRLYVFIFSIGSTAIFIIFLGNKINILGANIFMFLFGLITVVFALAVFSVRKAITIIIKFVHSVYGRIRAYFCLKLEVRVKRETNALYKMTKKTRKNNL